MDVVLLSNDVVPGGEVPVAAPGLRQWGMAEGLRSHGIEVELVVPRHVADQMWEGVPAPSVPGTMVLAAGELPALLEARSPCAVVLTNSNQHELVRGVPGVRYVYDFFAPKVLELVGQAGSELDLPRLASLRARKIAALAEADAVLLNGDKKLPYVLAWLLQTDRDVRDLPVLPVPMCVPVGPEDDRPSHEPLRVGMAGYLQPWSRPGAWLAHVQAAADAGRVELHVLLPPHWGDAGELRRSPELDRLVASEHVVEHQPKTYEAFVEFLRGLDLVLDLFERSLEREYAMVTRTVVALAAGRPVVHPSFTEVAPIIRAGGGGWLLDVEDPDLADRLDEVFGDPAEVRRRARAAQRHAASAMSPAIAVRPLVEQLRAWSR